MKPSLLLLTIVACFTLLSCQKEIDWSTNPTGGTGGGGTGGGGGGTGGGSGSGLLWKAVTKTGPTDSAKSEYTYNSANKVIRVDVNAVTSVGNVNSFQKYYRNATGNIYRMAQSYGFGSIVPPGIFPDSVVTDYGYTSSGKLLWGKFELSLLGLVTKDSSVLTLDTQDRIIKAIHYQADPIMGVFVLFGKSEYVYNSTGNLLSEKVYDYDVTTFSYDLIQTTTFEYDTKVNPLPVSNWDAHIMNQASLASANNVTKETYIDHTDPANNRTIITTYVYNAANKPVSGTLTITGQPNSTFTISYK